MRHRVKVDRRARPMADLERPWCQMAPLADVRPPELPRPGRRPSMVAAVAETRSPTAAQPVSIVRADCAVPCHAAQ